MPPTSQQAWRSVPNRGKSRRVSVVPCLTPPSDASPADLLAMLDTFANTASTTEGEFCLYYKLDVDRQMDMVRQWVLCKEQVRDEPSCPERCVPGRALIGLGSD